MTKKEKSAALDLEELSDVNSQETVKADYSFAAKIFCYEGKVETRLTLAETRWSPHNLSGIDHAELLVGASRNSTDNIDDVKSIAMLKAIGRVVAKTRSSQRTSMRTPQYILHRSYVVNKADSGRPWVRKELALKGVGRGGFLMRLASWRWGCPLADARMQSCQECVCCATAVAALLDKGPPPISHRAA